MSAQKKIFFLNQRLTHCIYSFLFVSLFISIGSSASEHLRLTAVHDLFFEQVRMDSGGFGTCISDRNKTHCYDLGIEGSLRSHEKSISAGRSIEDVAVGEDFVCILDGSQIRCWTEDQSDVWTTNLYRYADDDIISIEAFGQFLCYVYNTESFAVNCAKRSNEETLFTRLPTPTALILLDQNVHMQFSTTGDLYLYWFNSDGRVPELLFWDVGDHEVGEVVEFDLTGSSSPPSDLAANESTFCLSRQNGSLECANIIGTERNQSRSVPFFKRTFSRVYQESSNVIGVEASDQNICIQYGSGQISCADSSLKFSRDVRLLDRSFLNPQLFSRVGGAFLFAQDISDGLVRRARATLFYETDSSSIVIPDLFQEVAGIIEIDENFLWESFEAVSKMYPKNVRPAKDFFHQLKEYIRIREEDYEGDHEVAFSEDAYLFIVVAIYPVLFDYYSEEIEQAVWSIYQRKYKNADFEDRFFRLSDFKKTDELVRVSRELFRRGVSGVSSLLTERGDLDWRKRFLGDLDLFLREDSANLILHLKTVPWPEGDEVVRGKTGSVLLDEILSDGENFQENKIPKGFVELVQSMLEFSRLEVR